MSQDQDPHDKKNDPSGTVSPTKEQHPAKQSQELVPIERFDLMITNPTVVALSKAFHWKPETTIARIERALPAKFEQQVYLAVAESFRIQPESLAKILAIYRGPKPLSVTDLERRTLGKNVVTNSFGDFADFFEACMNLVKIIVKEYEAFVPSMELAAFIVQAFGNNHPEALIEMIDTNLDEFCEFFEISIHHTYSERMRLCTWLYIVKLLPKLRKQGVPDVLNVEEFFTHDALRRQCLKEKFDIENSEDDLLREVHDILNGGYRS